MKKRTIHLLGFIEFLILLTALLFFVLSSKDTMDYLALKVATKFDVSYDKLEGNLLKNITLKNIKYKNRLLAKNAHVDVNFKALIKIELKVDDITLEDVDLAVLEQMIKDQNSGKKKKKLNSIPTIEISSLFFSTVDYHNHGINIDKIKLIANDIKGDLTKLNVGSFSFYTQSDHTNITADGKVHQKVIDFNHLWITDIDIDKITQFYQENIKNKDSHKTKPKEEAWVKNLIKAIKIDNFKTDIKIYDYKKYKIQNLTIKANNLYSNLKSITADTTIEASTNMWKLLSDGKLKDDKFITDVKVLLDDAYFKRFIPFFDFNKIKPIKLKLTVDKNGLDADAILKTSNLLTKDLKYLNLSVQKATAHANLRFKPLDLKVKIKGDLQAKHSKDIKLDCDLFYDKRDKFRYRGTLFSKELRNLDKNIINLMLDTKVDFHGNSKHILATLENKNLQADYNSTIYKKGILSISSNPLTLATYIDTFPKELKARIDARVPIDFTNLKEFNSDIIINSNAFNIGGKVIYNKGFQFLLHSKLAKKSLLKSYDKSIKLKKLFPFDLKATLVDNLLKSSSSKNDLGLNFDYDTKTKELDLKLKLAGDSITLVGNTQTGLKLEASTSSLKTFQEKLAKFYTFKKQPLDGTISIKGLIKDNISTFDINSRWLVYEYTPNKFSFAEKIKLKLSKKGKNYNIQNYTFSTYLDHDRHFFANKNSTFIYKNNQLILQKIWINDQAVANGNYDIKKGKGVINLNAKNYHYKDKEGDIYADIALQSILTKKQTKIWGGINLQKSTITYKAKKDYYVQDDDIIIIQEQKTKLNEKNKDNLSIDISLLSKKPIRYKTDDTDVLLDVDLKFWKEASQKLELLGIAKLLEGEHYEAKKKFKIKDGEILFAGAILNPFLNINISHFSDPYDISININGLLDAPIINFSSAPYLTQSDILSILLFDSTTDDLFNSKGDSSKAALSMFGNTFAKELVANFGIKLDKLVLSTTEDGGFGVEIGKKISKKMTILYINDIVQTIKVKYQNSRRFETDITVSPDSSGIDFIYKNEY